MLSDLSDSQLGERLAARTLELIDIPSESRAEMWLALHLMNLLREGGVTVQDMGDASVLAGPADGSTPPILLAGHIDTVPAQGNIPGRITDGVVHGLGASDMKGALAVMVELVLSGAPVRTLFFPREELPIAESALTPLLARERDALDCALALVMEPTDNTVHAGCLGNINATWVFDGRSGHSARPWLADNAIEHAARGIAALAERPPVDHIFEGLQFREVASVTSISAGIAANVIPDRVECHLNYRYAPGVTPQAAERTLTELTGGHGRLHIDSNSPAGAVPQGNRSLSRLRGVDNLPMEPKQAWTPVAEFSAAGIDAVNFGPGSPAQAHRRDERIDVAAMVRSARILDRFVRL